MKTINYSDAIEEIADKRNQHRYLGSTVAGYKKDKKKKKEKLSRVEEDESRLDNLVYTCKVILERITYANKVKLEKFLTDSIRSIFIDRDYKIELVLKEDTKKPGLELTLTEAGVQQEITDAVGGGIISTLGLLLQIYYIEAYGKKKVMFIDEGLKEVSTGLDNESSESVNYLDNLLKFLHWLANEKQYALVIVTHDNHVRKFADRIYEVKLGEVI